MAALLAVVSSFAAQPAKRMPRIGYLGTGSASSANLESFRQGLRELGYIEGKTIAIEYRFADGKSGRAPELAADLVRAKPDVIVTSGTQLPQALNGITSAIPIVIASAGDLVGRGFVASLARPGGNITGLTTIAPDLSAKRLELLKELVPSATRVAVLYLPHEGDELRQTENAGRKLKVQILRWVFEGQSQSESLRQLLAKERADALLIYQNMTTSYHRREILEAVMINQVPTMCEARSWIDQGCLVDYAPNVADMYRRAATFVDKILKGRKPADLPVEQPTTFELSVNLKTAKQLGLTIPPSVLVRADHIVQ